MPAKMSGLSPYMGERRDITITREGVHVLIEVEEGAILLTPGQAAALAEGIRQQAGFADQAATLTGKLDIPPRPEGLDLRTPRDLNGTAP